MPQDWYGTLDAIVEGGSTRMPSVGRIIGLDEVPEAIEQAREPRDRPESSSIRTETSHDPGARRNQMTDRDEIVELTVRYATAIDSLQYSLLTTVFTDDSQVDYGEVGQWTGGAEVATFMEAVHAGAKTPCTE